MDKIIAKGMRFMGCHGILPEEKLLPQPFVVDCELYLNLLPASLSDELVDTVDYAEMFALVKDIVENKNFQLIEALAENIATVLIETYNPKKVNVTVAKPRAPVEGDFDYFAVSIER